MDEFTLSEVYIVFPKTYFNLKAIFFKQKYIDIRSLSQFTHLVSSLFFCDISSLLLLFSIGLHVCQCQNLKKGHRSIFEGSGWASLLWFDFLRMAGCLDNAQMPNLDNLNLGERRNKVASIVAGVLVSSHNNSCNHH